MTSMVRTLGLAAVALAVALPASANLIGNGDFEIVDGRIGDVRGKALDSLSTGRWDVYGTLPGGWYTSAGRGIEVQYDGVVVPAFSGNHYVELDSHPRPGSNSTMSLDLLLGGGDYLLEFAYRPRTEDLGDNGIAVEFAGSEVAVIDGFRAPGTDWEVISVALDDVAAGPVTLSFSAFGRENTLGGLLDGISLTGGVDGNPNEIPGTPTPEPGAALVFAAGLCVLGRARRRS